MVATGAKGKLKPPLPHPVSPCNPGVGTAGMFPFSLFPLHLFLGAVATCHAKPASFTSHCFTRPFHIALCPLHPPFSVMFHQAHGTAERGLITLLIWAFRNYFFFLIPHRDVVKKAGLWVGRARVPTWFCARLLCELGQNLALSGPQLPTPIIRSRGG